MVHSENFACGVVGVYNLVNACRRRHSRIAIVKSRRKGFGAWLRKQTKFATIKLEEGV